MNDNAESSRNDHCWWGKIHINTNCTKDLLNRLKLHRDHRLLQNIIVTIDFHCDLIYSRLQRKKMKKKKKRILCFDAETSTKTAASANKLIRTCKWKRKYKKSESEFPPERKKTERKSVNWSEFWLKRKIIINFEKSHKFCQNGKKWENDSLFCPRQSSSASWRAKHQWWTEDKCES